MILIAIWLVLGVIGVIIYHKYFNIQLTLEERVHDYSIGMILGVICLVLILLVIINHRI